MRKYLPHILIISFTFLLAPGVQSQNIPCREYSSFSGEATMIFITIALIVWLTRKYLKIKFSRIPSFNISNKIIL